REVHFPDSKLATGCLGCAEVLPGRCVAGVKRQGKYIRFCLDDGASLVVHLRMTGKFVFVGDPAVPSPDRHLRMVLVFTDDSMLSFMDVRRFGTLRLVSPGETPPELRDLGPDPLQKEMTLQRFRAILGKSRTAVKVLLLDQRRISGVGNIYACESLFRAGIDPRRTADSLTPEEGARLLRELRGILREAIRQNGTTISDFRNVDDKTGAFQHWLRVYERAGQPCRVCGQPIERIRQAQRSTSFCPHCQV
ncbi:MAG TPA: bifunctional DNA-formamidopyrimidine glycosylase/DNA-(apurinic or apyrimidinic site) lyase, partial [Spirochaetota bacterium]|nr:bifunctional DNA-formamidopyrimidine glycosylase/DNA-(apurinic or apyrimidinic site) lyase [Spirochaetota bacterium]